jgi:hypothetical protein
VSKMAETKEKEKETKEAPIVSVKSRGRISRSLEFLAKTYESKHMKDGEPTRLTRWVYGPQPS